MVSSEPAISTKRPSTKQKRRAALLLAYAPQDKAKQHAEALGPAAARRQAGAGPLSAQACMRRGRGILALLPKRRERLFCGPASGMPPPIPAVFYAQRCWRSRPAGANGLRPLAAHSVRHLRFEPNGQLESPAGACIALQAPGFRCFENDGPFMASPARPPPRRICAFPGQGRAAKGAPAMRRYEEGRRGRFSP